MVVQQIPYKYIYMYINGGWCWERSQFCFTFTTFQCLSYTKLVGCHGPTKRYFYIRVYILLYIYHIPFFLL